MFSFFSKGLNQMEVLGLCGGKVKACLRSSAKEKQISTMAMLLARDPVDRKESRLAGQ